MIFLFYVRKSLVNSVIGHWIETHFCVHKKEVKDRNKCYAVLERIRGALLRYPKK